MGRARQAAVRRLQRTSVAGSATIALVAVVSGLGGSQTRQTGIGGHARLAPWRVTDEPHANAWLSASTTWKGTARMVCAGGTTVRCCTAALSRSGRGLGLPQSHLQISAESTSLDCDGSNSGIDKPISNFQSTGRGRRTSRRISSPSRWDLTVLPPRSHIRSSTCALPWRKVLTHTTRRHPTPLGCSQRICAGVS